MSDNTGGIFLLFESLSQLFLLASVVVLGFAISFALSRTRIQRRAVIAAFISIALIVCLFIVLVVNQSRERLAPWFAWASALVPLAIYAYASSRRLRTEAVPYSEDASLVDEQLPDVEGGPAEEDETVTYSEAVPHFDEEPSIEGGSPRYGDVLICGEAHSHDVDEADSGVDDLLVAGVETEPFAVGETEDEVAVEAEAEPIADEPVADEPEIELAADEVEVVVPTPPVSDFDAFYAKAQKLKNAGRHAIAVHLLREAATKATVPSQRTDALFDAMNAAVKARKLAEANEIAQALLDDVDILSEGQILKINTVLRMTS